MKVSGQSTALAALSALPLACAITPELMLSTPRRSEAIPNPSGEWAVFSSTNYSWTEHASQTVWNLLNVSSGEVTLLYDGADIAEMVWVGPNPTSVIYVNGTNEEDDGGVSLYSADVTAIDSAQLIASMPAAYSGMKAVQTQSGDIHFLVNALSWPNGTAYNELLVETPLSTARQYTSIYVRHWDVYLGPQTYAVYGGVLTSSNGSYSFDGTLTNYVTGIKNVTTAETPVQPFGGSGDYDISPDGSAVIFLTKNPDLPLANFTSSQIYYVPFNGTSADAVRVNSFENAPASAQGATAAPTFSNNGQYIGYLQMDGISYESDRAKIYIANANPSNFNITPLAENWDRGPDLLAWSANDTALILGTSDRARERLFVVPITAGPDYQPANITNEGTVAAHFVLPDDTILVSDSKIWSSRDIYTISAANDYAPKYLLQANLVDENLSGLGPEDVSEFYFEGNFTQVQAFIVYPEGFDENKTYPLAFLIHGGPQSPWFNGWSNRWNMKTWADQGYVVVAPNPTASPGWGQAFVDAVQNNWGSYPYDDLVRCWNYVDQNLSYVDTANGIAAGASYGGYMVNWIQGHDLGRKFKALVTHDGSTNTNAQYASEELWFMQHDFNGTIWDNRDNYERWNPINHITEWATPHFVVHNDLDYRLPVAEGIYLFNVLQERGVPSKFLNFPDENHWVLKRENSIVWHTEIYKWINYYSGISNATSPY